MTSNRRPSVAIYGFPENQTVFLRLPIISEKQSYSNAVTKSTTSRLKRTYLQIVYLDIFGSTYLTNFGKMVNLTF